MKTTKELVAKWSKVFDGPYSKDAAIILESEERRIRICNDLRAECNGLNKDQRASYNKI